MVYYPIPAHRQKMFESFGLGELNLEVTDWLTSRVISLPIHTEMTTEQMTYITSNFIDIINSLS
jgi:UDP-2-acetamido-2-deoxy-ribo-hexuluronate aminotransferase